MNNQGGRTMQGGGRGPGGAVGVLSVVQGNDRGKQFPMVNPQTQIGRGADQDFILADIAVSRRHVLVVVEGARYRLKDLGSGNGTLINGVRTATAILNDGDQIEIGNTVLRFEHAPSRAGAVAPAPAPVPQVSPQQRTMLGDAPSGYGAPPPYQPPPASPYGAMPAGMPAETPSDAIPMPPARGGTISAPTPMVTGGRGARGGGLLDSPVKKAAVFGTAGVVVLLVLALVAKTLMGGGKAEAQKLFADGKAAYAAAEYDKAKGLFTEAAKKDPQLADTARYLKQCDVEIHARGAIAQARKLAGARQWDDAMKALDSIDKASASWDDAEKLRKGIVPDAVKAYLDEAKDAIKDKDADGAKQKIEQALLLDPDNADAAALQQQVAALAGGAVAAAPEKAAPEKAPRPAKVAAVEKPARPVPAPAPAPAPASKPAKPSRAAAAAAASSDEEDEGVAPSSGGGGSASDVLANKSAAGPYRARDFLGAATALRNAAKSMKGAEGQKAAANAAQIARLADAYQKAEADKARNPVVAVQEYQQAAAIDASVGHGTHQAYFKAQAGKLAKDAARQALSQQRYDSAFEMAKTAQRLTGDDGGVGAQLKAKATDLNNKAAAMARSNPNGATTMYRLVLRMVPPNDPEYARAQKGLATAKPVVTDEDED